MSTLIFFSITFYNFTVLILIYKSVNNLVNCWLIALYDK